MDFQGVKIEDLFSKILSDQKSKIYFLRVGLGPKILSAYNVGSNDQFGPFGLKENLEAWFDSFTNILRRYAM